MSQFISFAGSAGQARNPRRLYDLFGFGTSNGLQVTNNNGSNARSAFSTLGTATADLCGILLSIGTVSSNTPLMQFTIRLNGTTIIVPDVSFKLIQTNSRQVVLIPIQIPNGSTVEIAVRTSTNGTSVYFGAKGIKTNSLDPVGFANCEAILTINTGSVLPSATTVQDAGTWVALSTSTARAYGSLMFALQPNAAPTNAQRSRVYLSDGASGSEDANIFWEDQLQINAGQPYLPHALFDRIDYYLAAGSRLSAKVIGPTSAPDTFYMNAWGFY